MKSMPKSREKSGGIPEEYIPEGIREEQLAEFEKERRSIEEHRVEAKRMVHDLLTRDARILVLDLAQEGGASPRDISDERVLEEFKRRQFGGGEMTHGSIFRNILGIDPDDPRVTVWDVPKEPERKNLPFPDVWITTGGPAMPSELDRETENTEWLRRAISAQKELAKAGVPGVAVCLGHQLWEYSRGAKVGKVRPVREFGTAQLRATEAGKDLQLLYGFWDEKGEVEISASRIEGVITPPQEGEFKVLAVNDYSGYQAAVHSLRPDQPIEEAAQEDLVVLSIQHHPEIMAIYLEVLRHLRADAMRQEGLNPDQMIFKDTPKARNVWLRFIELAARRIRKRSE